MIIRKLMIRNYRGVGERKFSFSPSLVVLSPDVAETTLKALGIILGSEELAGPEETWELEAESEIAAEILLQDEKYIVRVKVTPESKTPARHITNGKREISPTEFFHRIHLPTAEERENCYLANRSYREVLDSYREPEKYYREKEFTKATEGIGDTGVFRRQTMALTRARETEKMDNLQLFVRVNTLWQCVQKIRDLHHEEWPVFIIAKEKTDNNELRKQISKTMQRQVFCSFSGGNTPAADRG